MRRHLIVYGVGAILLGIASIYDLSMNQFLYHPGSIFGNFMEHYFIMMIIMILPFTFLMLAKQKPSIITWVMAITAIIYSAQQTDKYMIMKHQIELILIVAIGIFIVMWIILQIIPSHIQKKLLPFLIFCCIVLIVSSVIVEIFKLSWGRVRFRSPQGPSRFTPWYLPQGYTGNKSFPSGHTTAASISVCLLALPSFYDIKLKPSIMVLAFGIPVLMAISRMIVGAHYLSDTTMGFLIVYTVFICFHAKLIKTKSQ